MAIIDPDDLDIESSIITVKYKGDSNIRFMFTLDYYLYAKHGKEFPEGFSHIDKTACVDLLMFGELWGDIYGDYELPDYVVKFAREVLEARHEEGRQGKAEG